MKHTTYVRAALAAVALIALAGCGTHYYSVSPHQAVPVGDGYVTGGASVTVTPNGVTVAPHANLHLPRSNRE